MKQIGNIFLTIIFIYGVFIFQNGFFLTRKELLNQNKCETIQIKIEKEKIVKFPTCIEEEYEKVIIFIIDGLRFDFLKYFESIKKQKENSYLIYKFVAVK
jgi:hypothetical protein